MTTLMVSKPSGSTGHTKIVYRGKWQDMLLVLPILLYVAVFGTKEDQITAKRLSNDTRTRVVSFVLLELHRLPSLDPQHLCFQARTAFDAPFETTVDRTLWCHWIWA